MAHKLRPIPPSYVKAYVKRGKSDALDAEAICEAVQRPAMRFAPTKTVRHIRRQRVNRMRGFRRWRWRLDETYVKLNGEMVYLRRAADHQGEVLESYATGTRNKAAALRFMNKTLKRHGSPDVITTATVPR